MTKFLDTYETWDKILKLVKDDIGDYYRMHIHDNCWNSPDQSIIVMNTKELYGLIDFLKDFIDEQQ